MTDQEKNEVLARLRKDVVDTLCRTVGDWYQVKLVDIEACAEAILSLIKEKKC
ncbi:hypothetical protein LCGC14_3066640 [marine sediment metagenome]|uniref:Uncharacterized protein n=1 Tax=marine sediment metagenome TaxID=412755 RepID=A0A0F8WHY6_9ZZZZ